MDPSAMLHVTEKGADEIAHRTFGLGIRQRGMMLLLLGKPQALENILRKSLLPTEESLAIIRQLLQDGFLTQDAALASAPRIVAVNTGAAASVAPAAAMPAPKASPSGRSGDEWHIDDEAIISEGKFLLIDFCMDCFGTQAQKLIGRFRACKTADELTEQTKGLVTLINQNQPAKLDALRAVVRAINETA